jgi:hypothetical protein
VLYNHGTRFGHEFAQARCNLFVARLVIIAPWRPTRKSATKRWPAATAPAATAAGFSAAPFGDVECRQAVPVECIQLCAVLRQHLDDIETAGAYGIVQ